MSTGACTARQARRGGIGGGRRLAVSRVTRAAPGAETVKKDRRKVFNHPGMIAPRGTRMETWRQSQRRVPEPASRPGTDCRTRAETNRLASPEPEAQQGKRRCGIPARTERLGVRPRQSRHTNVLRSRPYLRRCLRGSLCGRAEEECWSGRPDSNRRPPAPKAGALPGCATPRSASILPHLSPARELRSPLICPVSEMASAADAIRSFPRN